MRLLPYGALSAEYQKLADATGRILDWKGTETEFDNMFESVRADIAEHIWPAFDRASRQWVGGATDFAEQMTFREIELMIDHFQGSKQILETFPSTPNYHGTNESKKHMWHFQIEDDVRPEPARQTPFELSATGKPGANFIFYDNRVDPDSFSVAFATKGAGKVNTLFRFKTIFQRPRACQAALVAGRDDFVWHIGKIGVHTGIHPSIISGHCLQGILMNAAVLEGWLDEAIDVDAARWDALTQFAADFGDRRVMAGIHHPTDNIASWILALRVIPKAFRHADVIEKFAREAITKKSMVYQLIKNTFPQYPELAGPLQLLNSWV